MTRCRTAPSISGVVCAATLLVASVAGAQTSAQGEAGFDGQPTITSTEDAMTVGLPDGEVFELKFDSEPPAIERRAVERSRSLLKSGGCDPYMNRYAGYAPFDPASHTSLGLPPIDANCDGRPDRPWYVNRQLDWHSVDSRLGAVDLTNVGAIIIRTVTRGWNPTTNTLFVAIDSDGEVVTGYVRERGGQVWGRALVGRHGQGTVRYRLFAAADEPLSVAILESGTPVSDNQLFDRAVVFTAAVDGGSGAADLSAAINGSPYSLGTSYGVEGFHTIEVTATSGDETATASAAFAIDLSPPEFDQILPADGALLGAPSVTISGQVSADTALVTVDGVPAVLGSPSGEWRSFTAGPLILAEGPHALALHAEDDAGRTTDQQTHLVIDTLAPELAIASPPNDFVTGNPRLSVSGTVVDPNLAGVTVNGAAATFGGGSFTAEVDLPEGVSSITAVATDTLGHVAEVSISVIVDTTTPVLSVFESGAEFTGELLLGRPAVITVVADDATEVELVASIDGQPYMLGTPYADGGSHSFEVTATDAAGNTAAESRSFTIDNDPPLVDELSPPAGSVHDGFAIDLSGRVSEDAVDVTVGGVAAVLGVAAGGWIEWAAQGVALEQEGYNELLLRAADGAGNVTELVLTYQRDTADPQITLTEPAEGLVTRFSALTVSGVASDSHLDRVTVNGVEATVGADGSFAHGIALVEGANSITVTATDVVLHETTVTGTVTLDAAPPVLTVTNGGAPLADGLVSSEPVTPVIEAIDDTAVTLEITLNGVPFVSGTPVTGEGSYVLLVSAEDAAGNAAGLERTFSLDLTPPVISGLSPVDGSVIADPSPLLTGACDDAVSVMVDGQPAAVTAGTFSYAGLSLAEGANAITVIAADEAGNESTATVNITLDTTGPSLTVTAPADGALVGETSVTVTGTATDPHLESVTVDGRDSALAGSSFQTEAPLAQEGANVLTIVAVDRAGNSSELVLTVERDTTAPTLTVDEPGPSAILGSTTVAVSGTVTDTHETTVTVDSLPATPAPAGAFAIELNLPEGGHTLTVEAADEAGNRSIITREISVDLSAPELSITAPSAGAILDVAVVTVTGTVSDVTGTDRVTVNGLEAQLDEAGAFELADLALDEGANTIVARAWDAAGNSGTRSIEVVVDTVPPAVLSTVPGDSASGVPTTARPRVRFSEPVAEGTLASGIRLTRDGQPLQVELSTVGDGAEVDVAPVGGLADNSEHVLSVDAAVTDRAGHPLELAASASFTTVDSTAPGAPILNPIDTPLCFTSLVVSGLAEAGATVLAAGDIHPSSTDAAADGTFTLVLEPAVGEGAVEIEVVAEDPAGNQSQPAYLVVELDCTSPQVMASHWDGDTTITVRFSEELDESTVTVDGLVILDGALSPLEFTTTVTGGTLNIELAAAKSVGPLPLRLELSADLTDLAGNPATPYSQLYADPAQATLIAGEVFSDSDSLELAGARIVLEEDGGPILGDQPTVTADGRGRYQLPVIGSPVTVRIEADDYLPSWRRAVPIPGAAALLFDVRLSRRADPVTVDAATQIETKTSRLTISGASVPVDGFELELSSISEQGLPGLLPLGWRPLAAAQVGLPEGLVLDPPAALEFLTDVPPEAVIARYDGAVHAWFAEAFGGTLEIAESATFALLVPDLDPTNPGSAVLGSVLPAAFAGDPGDMTATLQLDPPIILPMETSLATVTVVPTTAVPSGHPVEARLDEVLHVVDGGVLVTPPVAVDLFLYRQPDETLMARFDLGASEAARRIALDEGVKIVNIRSLPDDVRIQDLVGPAGADLLSPDGVGLHVPNGALGRVVGVELGGQPLSTLPLVIPAGLEAVAAANLGLGDTELTFRATLSFPGAGEPDGQYLLLSPIEVEGESSWRLVGLGGPDGERIVCGPGQLDGLPAPGVLQSGLYVLVRPIGEPWGLLTGTVNDVDFAPATETCLVSSTGGLVQLTEDDGVYALVAPAGTVDLSAEQLVSRNTGVLVATATGGTVAGDLDIQLAVVRPRVIATSPANDADRVATATPITIDFSEPLDLEPDNPWGVDVLVIAGPVNEPGVGDLELSVSGTRLTWTPAASFPSASRVQVTVDGSLRDRQGNLLEGGDFIFEFGVERYIGYEDVNESKIRLFVPGRDPLQPDRAVVEGEAGAVPADIWMFIEDLDHDAPVTTFQADGDGAFGTSLEMFDTNTGTGVQIGDRLRLHILDSDNPNDELYVLELKPWLTADGLGAFFNIDGGEFITTEGITVNAPWGAFPETGSLRVTLVDHSDVLPQESWPSFAEARGAARLELTVVAARTLQLVIPGDPPTDPNTTMHACMRIEVAGRPYPMLMRTAWWDADLQAYVTSPAEDTLPENAANALAKAAADGNPDPLLPGIRQSMHLVVLEPVIPAAQKSAIAGLKGRLLLLKGTVEGDVEIKGMFLDKSGTAVYANTHYAPSDAALVGYDFGGPAKYYDDPTGAYAHIGINEVLAQGRGATMPLRPDDEFVLRVTDPDTGYTYSEQGYDAPGSEGWVDISPSEAPGYGDRRARIVGGSPFMIFSFEAAAGRTSLTHLLEVNKADASAKLVCDIPTGALPGGRYIRLINLRTGAAAPSTPIENPHHLELAANVGDPVILVLEPLLSLGDLDVIVRFDRALDGLVDSSMVELVPTTGGSTDSMHLSVEGDALRIAPDPVWEAGERYELQLSPSLFAALGSPLEGGNGVKLPIKVSQVVSDDPYAPQDAITAEAALENNLVLIAARENGLLVYDISDPGTSVLIETVQTAGPMAGVESDGFGNVVTLEGRVGEHVVLRLWSLDDLTNGEGAEFLGHEALAPPLTGVGPGDLELEVFADSLDFTAADPPGEIVVVPDSDGGWASLTVSEDFISANHPVVLIDAVSDGILWSGWAPAEGPLPIVNDSGIPDLPLAHPLRLRAHADTLVWAHAAAGPVIAASISFDGDGAKGFSLGAVGENEDLLSWIRGAGAAAACRNLGPEDSVYLGRLAATPRRDGENLILAASRYEGIWGFEQRGAPQVSPDWIQCVRSAAAGSDLADIASARVPFVEDGKVVERDIVAVVGHRRLEIFEALDGRNLEKFADGFDLGWNAFRVAIDPVDRLVLVRDNAHHLAVFLLTSPGTPLRMVADILLPMDAGLGPLVLDPDLGFAITGTSPVQYKPPRIELVTDRDGDGIPEPVEYLQPLGVPEAPADSDGRRPPYLAWVRARIVGVPDNQDTVAVKVEGLGPGGGVLPERPEPFLPSSRVITLRRPTGLPLHDPGRNVFVSDQPILLIADERARTDYWKNIDETLRGKLVAEDEANARYALCRNCERDLDGDGAIDLGWSDDGGPNAPIELAAAGRLRITFDAENATGWIANVLEVGMAPSAETVSLPWMPSPPIGRDPGIEVRAAMLPEVELATGALSLARTDLVLPAPGMDVYLGREYSSAGIRYGLFGWGWELAGLDRLRPNPDGTVELYTSSGDRFVFGNSAGHPGAAADTLTAWGHPGELKKSSAGGYFILLPDGSYTEFDVHGYPTHHRDRFRKDKKTGSELRYSFYPDGTLAQISQSNGTGSEKFHSRTISFTYKTVDDGVSTGLIETAEDAALRKWEYEYDGFGRLTRATINGIVLDANGTTGDHFERYGWIDGDPSTAILSGLRLGARIDTVHDAEGRKVLDADPDGSDPARVGKLCQGEICNAVSSVEADGMRQRDITDASNRKTRYVLDDLGRIRELRADPEGDNALTAFLYESVHGDQLVNKSELPAGRVIHHTWQSSNTPPGPRRTWWNLRTVLDIAGANDSGVEGEVPAQTTLYDYKTNTDLLTSVTLLPVERTTTIDRSAEAASNEPKRIITDPENRKTTLILDALGRIAEERLYDTYTTSYKYDELLTGCGEVREVTPPTSDNLAATDPKTETITQYSPYGFPKSVAVPSSSDGNQQVIHKPRFNELGWQLKQTTDGVSDQITFVYDRSGWLSKEIHGSGDLTVTVTHEALASGLEKKTIEEGGDDKRTIEYTYNDEGVEPDGLIRSTKTVETGRETVLAYDRRGRVNEHKVKIDEDKWAVTEYHYGRNDDLVTKIVAPERSDGTSNEIKFAYDGFGRQRRATDGINRIFITEYDPAGRVGETRVEFGGTVWRKETFQYNLVDQPTLKTLVDTDDGSRHRESEFVYNSTTGLLEDIFDPEDRKTTIQYDSSGLEKLRILNDGTTIGTRYWPSGLVAQVTETPSVAGVGNPSSYVTESTYDGLGRMRTIKRPSSLVSSVFYDALGRVTRTLDPPEPGHPGRLTYIESSPLGLYVDVTDPGSRHQVYTYDQDGHLKTMVDESGAMGGYGCADEGENDRIAYKAIYDLAGRTLDVCRGGSTRTTSWESDGSPKATILTSNRKLGYCTDVAGRVKSVAYMPAETEASPCDGELPMDDNLIPTRVSFDRDPLDRINRATDNRGLEIIRTWTFGSELKSETLLIPIPGDAAANKLITVTSATYDNSGLPETLTYPDGTVVDTSDKDDLGRISAWKVQVPGQISEQRWSASYGGMRQIGGGLPAGLQVARTYHSMGIESGRSAFLAGGEARRSYRFQLGRQIADTGRATVLDVQSTVPSRHDLARDTADRFSYWGRSEGIFLSASDVNDDLPDAPPVKVSLQQLETAHSESAGPNEIVDLRGWYSGLQLRDHYVPGTDHRMVAAEHTWPELEGKAVSVVLWEFSHDALGNRERDDWVSGTLEFNYTHDWANRLVRVEKSLDGSADELFLGQFGRRLLSTINGVVTLRVPWGDQIIAEYVVARNSETGEYEKSLRKRLYWYGGVDRLAGYDLDSDLDGAPESSYSVLTGPQGTVHAILDDDGVIDDGEMLLEPGRIVESYLYWPDGTFQIVGPDLERPRLKRAEVFWPDAETETVVLLFSEIVVDGREGVIELQDADGEVLQAGPWKAWLGGRGRSLDLSETLEAGDTYRLVVDGMEDLSGNLLDRAYVYEFIAGEPNEGTVIWQEPGGQKVLGKAAGYTGQVLQIIDGPTEIAVVVDERISDDDISDDSIIVRRNGAVVPGRVQIHDLWNVRKSRAIAKSDTLEDLPPYPFVVLWEPQDPSTYIAFSDNPLTYEVTVDLGGLAKSAPTVVVNHTGEGGEIWSDWFDAPLLTATQVGNDRFQHGRPFITFVPNRIQLYDHRARWFEPKTYRFLELDPLGPVDSPNMYQAFGFDGMNVTDPYGEYIESGWDIASIGIGVTSAVYNLSEGNFGAAAWDILGVGVDAVALALPGVPGGVGALTKGARAARVAARTAQTAVWAGDVGQGAYQSSRAFSEGQYGWGAFYAGLSTFGGVGAARSVSDAVKFDFSGPVMNRTDASFIENSLTPAFSSRAGVPRSSTRFPPGTHQVKINKTVGDEWDDFVAATRLRKLSDAGRLEKQVYAPLRYDPDIAQTAVKPDYVLLNRHNQWAAIGEAKALKSRLIEATAQAQGLVRWAKATETKQLIYYVPWETKIHRELLRFARRQGVSIRTVVVR